MSIALGVTAGVAAGASFATGGVLQQRVAARTKERSLSVRLLESLARRPEWLAGIGVAAVSYGLQALALSAAPLAVVQPLLTTELVFAIPISARLYGRPLRKREWAGLVAVAGGLAAALWGAAPAGTGGGGTPLRWAVLGGTLAVVAGLLATAGWRRQGLSRASLYAAAAALVFALSSALLASAVAGFAAHGIGGLANPAVYGMAAASIAGLLLIQSAFQAGPLAVSMPLLDWAQPFVAVVLGVTVLGESLDTAPVHVVVLAAGALAALAGIITLDTSPRVRTMQQPAAVPAGPPPAAPAPAHGHPDAAAFACCHRAARLGYRGNHWWHL